MSLDIAAMQNVNALARRVAAGLQAAGREHQLDQFSLALYRAETPEAVLAVIFEHLDSLGVPVGELADE